MNFLKLQHYSLLNKVCSELDNQLGLNDKTLSEFIIDLANSSKTPTEFTKNLAENGAEFPGNFTENLYRIIQRMTPKESTTPKIKIEEQPTTLPLPSLTIPDTKPIKLDENSKEEIERKIKKERDMKRKREFEDESLHKKKQKSEENDVKYSKSVEPEVNEIYYAKVTSIKDFGFFAVLLKNSRGENVKQNREGLCHISQIKNRRITSVSEEVNKGDSVYVKVLQIVASKISLSMKEVDQKTGENINKQQESSRSNPSKPVYKDDDISDESDNESHNSSKALTAYELFEMNQMVNSGAMDIQEHPSFDKKIGMITSTQDEKQIEIEKKDYEPNFLKGQTINSGVHHEPMKIIKAPEGSLQRASQAQSSLAQERRLLRQSQKNSLKDTDKPTREKISEITQQNLKLIGDTSGGQMPEWKKETMNKLEKMGQKKHTSIKETRESLPIFKVRDQLLTAIDQNQTLVIIGETGSGKTTQLTQYLAEAGYTKKGIIGCTQPRRVAAISVAKRVSEEVGCKVGQEVGYTIRFEDKTSKATEIKYMTDGMLLREALNDGMMSNYSVIILDEAHERSIHTDVLFGLCKKLLSVRKDLKLIVTSATLDAEKFAKFFGDCPIFRIQGNTFPVTLLYTKEPESDYLDAALVTVLQIHLNEGPGDILLFLTGQEEIDTACEVLYERMKTLGSEVPDLLILPVYSALPSEMQSKIFEPAPDGTRKVVIATNIAETSITIDNILYVIDPGFVKQNVYNAKTGVEQLVVTPISQAQARQRSGRAGRVAPGKCYRLYTEIAYKNEMLQTSIPEIQRTNLGNVVLMLKAMGINDLLSFPFMDPPPTQLLISAMEQLYSLGALDDEGLLTKLGRRMAEFPLEPQLSKVLIKSVELKCSDEILSIVSMLSVDNIYYRPKDKAQIADEKKKAFDNSDGDHLSLLSVYQGWEKSDFSQQWCYDHFIQARSLRRAKEIRGQLINIMDRFKLDIISSGKSSRIRKAITSGFFTHAARKDPQEGYKTLVEQQNVFIHPSSSLFQKNPDWVIYHQLVMTSKEYMRDIIKIDPKWLIEFSENYYKMADGKSKKVERLQPMEKRLK